MELLANIVAPLALVVMGGGGFVSVLITIAVIWLVVWLISLIPMIPPVGRQILYVVGIIASVIAALSLLGGL